MRYTIEYVNDRSEASEGAEYLEVYRPVIKVEVTQIKADGSKVVETLEFDLVV